MGLLTFSASAAGGLGISVEVPRGAHFVSLTTIKVDTSGAIEIQFQGSRQAGCERRGLCGYSGQIKWLPLGPAELDVVTFKLHHRLFEYALFTFGAGNTQPTAHARVARAGGGTCVDSGQPVDPGGAGWIKHRSVEIALDTRTSDQFVTRCAGPLDADIAPDLPTRSIPIREALHGRLKLDFQRTASFAANGFSGTVTSTIELRLDRPHVRNLRSMSRLAPGSHPERDELVTAKFRATRISGSAAGLLSGSSARARCARLDSCGLTGSLAFDFTAGSQALTLTAIGPAERPYDDYLAALGLRAGSTHGIEVAGFWQLGTGSITEQVFQDGSTCSDSAPSDGELYAARGAHDSIKLALAPATADGDVPRTRCPGPTFAGQGILGFLQAAVPATTFGRRSFTLTLRAGHDVSDGGYVFEPTGTIRITLRRASVRRQTFTLPSLS